MKGLSFPKVLAFISIIATLPVCANTYYSKVNGNANTVGAWGLNNDGTGSNPLNFTTSGDVFILRSGSVLGISGDWTIGSGVTLQMYGDLDVTVNNRDITINGTIIFFDASSTQVSLTGGGNGNNFTVSAGATLITANVNGIKGSNCSLPATASGTITLSTAATYKMVGTGQQSLTGIPASIANLAIDNTSGVLLNSTVNVTNSLTLTNGILTISAGNSLTITSGNVISGTGFGNSKHINTQTSGASEGILRVNGITGSYLFPVGNGTYYLPVTIITTSASDIRINALQGITRDGSPTGTPFTASQKSNLVDAVWSIDRPVGSGQVLLTVGWDQALEGASFSSLANNEMGIAMNNGTSWDPAMGIGNQVLNNATRTGLTSVGKFGVGKAGIPLPLKFGDLSILDRSNRVTIQWTSLTEMNIRNYEIERSADGRDFNVIGTVNPAGNNYSRNDYSWDDLYPLAGSAFYRVKANDIDGKGSYSNILRYAGSGTKEKILQVYPNPVIGKQMAVQLEGLIPGSYELHLVDMAGRVAYHKRFEFKGDILNLPVPLPSSVTHGIYAIRITGESGGMDKVIQVN